MLRLPFELRNQILTYLLYSSEPLGKEVGRFQYQYEIHLQYSGFHHAYKIYPSILAVCRQIYEEGYEILYHQNTAYADIRSRHIYSRVLTRRLTRRDLHPMYLTDADHKDNVDLAIVRRFTKWKICIMAEAEQPSQICSSISQLVREILYEVQNLDKLKVQLDVLPVPPMCADEDAWIGRQPPSFDEVAYKVLQPFEDVRVREAEFVNHHGHPIDSAFSLRQLITYNFPLSDFLKEINLYINKLVDVEEHMYEMPCLVRLKTSCDQHDVSTFRRALLEVLEWLIYDLKLDPPQHLRDFAGFRYNNSWDDDYYFHCDCGC